MNGTLKPVEDQVIVITGATSGIGLATARMAAKQGAELVLAARSEDALDELVDEIWEHEGDAVHVVADVRNREDVLTIAAVAEDTYDGFDTWVNAAAGFLYGRLDETPIEDMRNQFETNVWGLLYGSLEAADHLRERGGAIINVGSVASDRAIPLQGSYSASKHAARAFTDTLRMELEKDDAPVSVTLVKPAAIDTPYPEHAKNNMDREADLPSPVYAPETVARAILHAAEHPERDVFVGGAAKGIASLGRYAPKLMDRIMESRFFQEQRTDRPPESPDRNNFEGPTGDLEERGGYDGYVAETSLYTRLTQGEGLGRAVFILVTAAILALWAQGRESGEDEGPDLTRVVREAERSDRPIQRLAKRFG